MERIILLFTWWLIVEQQLFNVILEKIAAKLVDLTRLCIVYLPEI